MRWLVSLALLLSACSGVRPISNTAGVDAERRAADQALQRAAGEPGAVVTESGSVVRILAAGRGRRPQASETVTIRYRTSLLDGHVIDSTESRPVPPTVQLDELSPCFAESLRRMSVGAKGRATCRYDALYAGRVLRGVSSRTAMVVDLELVEVGMPLPPPGH